MPEDHKKDKGGSRDAGQGAKVKSAAKKPNWLLRMVLTVVVLSVATLALGYLAFHLLQKGNTTGADLKKQRARATTCTKKLSNVELGSQKCDDSLKLCQRKRNELDTKQRQIATSMVGMVKNLDSTKKELIALRKQRAETAKRLAAFQDLTAKFRKMIDSGKLKVVLRNGRMVVKLPAGVLFASGAAALSRAGEMAIMEVAIVFRQLPGRKFMVVGHTDNRPLESSPKSRYKNNWELSTGRAVTVTKFLIEAKMSPKNLVAAGHAEFDPVGDNKTVKGRQENRRIEIVLMPDIKELPPTPKK